MPKYVDAFRVYRDACWWFSIIILVDFIFGPKEKIAKEDFPRIIAAAFFGVAFNMLTFSKD